MSIFNQITNYGKMVKFSHTLFALPFAGLSLILSLKNSELTKEDFIIKSILVLICMVSARNAAMGFNRLIDADIDKLNPRTKNREIPAGVINKKSVIIFIILFSISFIVSTYFLNDFAFRASIPTLMIVLGYSYTKRITWLCHYILGLGIGLAPTGAWVALKGELDLLPVLFSGGLLFHIAGFDILYSTQDYKFDSESNLYSIPSKFGIEKSLLIAKLNHIISVIFLVYAGVLGNLKYFYFLFLIIAVILFIIEHRMVNKDDLSKIPIAFFNINASISVVLFMGILLDNWSLLLRYLGD